MGWGREQKLGGGEALQVQYKPQPRDQRKNGWQWAKAVS